jgi:hypothetical protein
MPELFRPTLRFSGSPTQLNKEARSGRVRCKRVFGAGVPFKMQLRVRVVYTELAKKKGSL